MTNIPRWPSAPAIRVAISDLDGNCEVDGRGRNAPLTYRTGAEGALIALMANMPSSRHTSPVAFLSTPTAAWVNRHRRRQQPGDACQDLPEHPSQHCSLGLWKATNGSSASVQYSLILLGILTVHDSFMLALAWAPGLVVFRGRGNESAQWLDACR